MAKLTIKEVFVGTDEQIKVLEEMCKNYLKTADPKFVDNLDQFDFKAEYETALQKQLRAELEQIRPLLNADGIVKAEELIRSFDGSATTADELLASLLNGTYKS